MKRLAIMFVAGLAMMAFGTFAGSNSKLPAPSNNVVTLRSGEAQMDTARAKAKAGLPAFWAAAKAQAPGTEKFLLKVAFSVGAASSEHIWVSNFRSSGTNLFVGQLANQPEHLDGLKHGDRVEFTAAQISDWMFMRNGKIVGNETAKPLLAHLPKDEATRILARFETP